MVLFLFIAGCGGKNDPGHSSNQITVAVSGDVLNWDLVKFPDGDTRFIWSQVYETLVRLDTDLKEQPGLAVSWEPSEEGKVWTFNLRQGVKFHDGSPFNAAAV
jgi:peptide/nickel transport system substrate-binding protein